MVQQLRLPRRAVTKIMEGRKVLQLLLEFGADVNAPGGTEYKSALAAVRAGERNML